MGVTRFPEQSNSRADSPKLAHQFLIALNLVDPLVWRRIQVPRSYTFWDLHVAIQDAMGGKTGTFMNFDCLMIKPAK